jgi:hypothetical protein
LNQKRTALPLALVLLFASPKNQARAEDSVAYKFENYTESGGRVGVQTQGLAANQDIGADSHISLTMVTDTIAGATPTGIPAPSGSDQVQLAHLSDHRKSWESDVSHQFDRINISLVYSQSREHDYISRGWSLNTLTDFNEKNTTLLFGMAGHDDDVETFFDPQRAYLNKHALSSIVGLTQIVDPLTRVTLDITWSRETGYLSDQYKLVLQDIEVIPGSTFPLAFAENLPGTHTSGVAYLSVNRALPSLNAAIEANYRFYADTFGIAANSLEMRWFQSLGKAFTLAPEARIYEQNAAKFYYYDLTTTTIIPTQVPDGNGVSYSSDYRLSSLYTTNFGIKLTWNPKDWLQFDAAVDHYTMRGRDGVTPQSAYPRANIVTLGTKLSW